jgi:hypothetical protein
MTSTQTHSTSAQTHMTSVQTSRSRSEDSSTVNPVGP